MNKYNNPRLLNAVVSGTGMKHPVQPHVVVGDVSNGFIRGDLMDANAIVDLVNSGDAIDQETIRQAVADIIGTAPENLDTLGEIVEALDAAVLDPNTEGSLANQISVINTTIEDNELTIAAALNDLNSRLLELVTRVSTLEEEINTQTLADGLYKFDHGSGVIFSAMEINNGNIKVYAQSTDEGNNINVYNSTGSFLAGTAADSIISAIEEIAETYDNFGTIEKMVEANGDISNWSQFVEIVPAE